MKRRTLLSLLAIVLAGCETAEELDSRVIQPPDYEFILVFAGHQPGVRPETVVCPRTSLLCRNHSAVLPGPF